MKVQAEQCYECGDGEHVCVVDRAHQPGAFWSLQGDWYVEATGQRYDVPVPSWRDLAREVPNCRDYTELVNRRRS